MAELLIRLKSNTHSDPVKDRMCYKRGDVVVVKPYGHEWGRAEALPDFAVIGTDRTVAEMEAFADIHETPQTETLVMPLIEWTRIKARGKYEPFTTPPVEGAAKILRLGPKQKRITTISLTGPVLRPHTRRKWGLGLATLSRVRRIQLLNTGWATIPFKTLRLALKDKITGVQA